MHFSTEHLSSTKQIDSLRFPITQRIIDDVRQSVDRVCTIDNRKELWEILLQYFPTNKNRVVRDFFTKNPVCWYDFIRKIHKFRKNDSKHGWYIDQKWIEDIYASFLVRWRAENIGEKLREQIHDAVIKNQDLIEYASKQDSILNSWGYSFSHIPKSQRKSAIKKLLSFWLIKNIDGCTYENIDEHFSRIFEKLLNYTEEVFGITIHLRHCKDIEQLTKELEKMFEGGHGDDRENAFRVIQAFHAWGNLEDVENTYYEAQQEIKELPNILRKIGLAITDTGSTEENGVIIYFWKFQYNNHIYNISWRPKTPKSSLQKEWEDEEYGSMDVIRDTIGVSIVWPDDTPAEDKNEIIVRCATLMPDFWYLFKDKWEIGSEGVSVIEKKLIEKKKHPVYTSRKRDDATSKLFRNMSLSGFMKYKKQVFGTEFQFSSQSAADWKKEDDKKYKPRSAIKALMRWPKFATPKQCFDLLNKRVNWETLKKLNLPDVNAMIWEMIEDKFLHPYVSEDGSILILTSNGKEELFREQFPSMQYCDANNAHFWKMRNYIIQLGSESYFFVPPRQQTFSQLLFPDPQDK